MTMHNQDAVLPAATVQIVDSAPFRKLLQQFCLVLLQLVLITLIVREFQIEQQRHFLPLLCYIVCGFVIHAWLPLHFRQTFFAILSAGSLPFMLGAFNGLCVIGICGLCIGVLYLPVRFALRAVLLFATVATLVYFRSSVPLPFWPVAGSILMFRLLLFAYEIRHSRKLPPPVTAISYFFMLPNACFPFFPVVDYRTFLDSRYRTDEWQIYQRGIVWIVRGLSHLLVYRVIRTYLVPDINDLQNVKQIAIFIVTNYALYLQVSGQFHVITGLLHLFGFDLPRTHNQFFLAASFSDIWRRINIYWKDFMTKLFFFPAFFMLRRQGASVVIAVSFSVFWVFLCTWLLHSWQTFWLLGRFPVTANDAWLWLGVGCCVAVNAAYDSRQRKTPGPITWRSDFSLAVRTVAMFLLVGLFWACWTKPGFLNTVRTLSASPTFLQGQSIVLLTLAAAVAAGTLLAGLYRRRKANEIVNRDTKAEPVILFRESALLHCAALGAFLAMSSLIPGSLPESRIAAVVSELKTNAAASDDQLRGYYEDLNSAALQAGPLVSSFFPVDESRRAQAEGFNRISRAADLYQGLELIPGITAELNGSLMSVNQFGMRDRSSVTVEKLSGVKRFAFVGSSIVMGYGVTDEQVFARRLESRLNSERAPDSAPVEILNFGVGKQWAAHRLIRIQRQVVRFSPDVLFYFAHQDEFRELASHTGQLVANGLELPSEHLKTVAQQAGVTSDMPPGGIHSRLLRKDPELLAAIYQTIVDECRSHGVVPVWVYLPIPDPGAAAVGAKLLPVARDAEFMVADLSDWHHGKSHLFASAEDHHPNAQGHELIAESLFRWIQEHPDWTARIEE